MQRDILAEIAKLPLLAILDLSFQVEYKFIVNLPRLLDRIIYVEKIASLESEIAKILDRLTKDSIRHADWTAKMIRELGGEPKFEFELIDESISIAEWCIQQWQRESSALYLYEQAKKVAEQNQPKGLWGRLRAKSASFLAAKEVASPRVIEYLDKLAAAEREHMELMRKAIRELDILIEE